MGPFGARDSQRQLNTPYPGTETFLAEAQMLTTRDYRLFDIQHAVLPARLPLDRF